MRALALALALGVGLAAPAARAELHYDPWPHAAITTGIGLIVAGEIALRPSLTPQSCNHCGGNAFDRSITESLAWENHELATSFSDVGHLLLPASAIAMGFVRDGGEKGLIDGIVFLETLAVNFVATEVLKVTVARERPERLYLDPSHAKVSEDPGDWFISFPSGHASTSFVSVAASATIADLRGHDPLPIWLIGLPVATGVAYFRVAGVHHWTTDVLAGAALGTLIGIGLPRLLHGGLFDDDEDPAPGNRQEALRAPPVQIFQVGGAF